MTQPPGPPLGSPSTLGGRIQAARKRLRMTQTLLGETTGASQPLVAKWENDQRTPSHDVVVALSKVLQVPLSWLEGDDSDSAPELGEAELESLMEARRERLRLILGGHVNLKELAEKSGLEEAALQLAQEGKRTLTLDETSRIALAANFSLSWLLYGEQQTPFSLEEETLKKVKARGKGAPEGKEKTSEKIRRLYKMDAILERRHRFVPLLWDTPEAPSIAELSGVPQEAIEAFMEGRGDLSMDQIEKILEANGVSFDWVMHGEDPSFLTKIASRFEALSTAMRSFNEEGRSRGFLGWLSDRRGKKQLEHILRYVRLKPLLEWVLTSEVYLPKTLSQCESELAKRLNPKKPKMESVDWDSLETAQAMLAYAGMNWFSQERPNPEVLRLAYQHALKRSISGLEPDEAFIEELRRMISEELKGENGP